MNDSLSIFSTGIVTYKDLLERLGELQSLLTSNQASNSISINKEIYQIMARYGVREEQLSPIIPSSEQEVFVKKIIDYLKSLPVVKITLAFVPTEDFSEVVAKQLEDSLGKKIVLDITTNQSIVGGLQIEFSGKYKDYSLGPKLEEYLKRKQSAQLGNSNGVKEVK